MENIKNAVWTAPRVKPYAPRQGGARLSKKSMSRAQVFKNAYAPWAYNTKKVPVPYSWPKKFGRKK